MKRTLAALALVTCCGATAVASSDRSVYIGRDTRLTILREGQQDPRARFKANDVSLVCTGEFWETDLPARDFRFIGPRVFQGQRFEREPNGDWSYFEAKGRLRGGGRANGFLYYLANPYDPAGAENRPECSTGGQLYVPWQAKRRGRSEGELPTNPRRPGPTAQAYQGTFRGDPAASVEVSVETEDGQPRTAMFDASDFQIECEDASSPRRIDYGPILARFAGGDIFETRYRPLPQGAFHTLFKVQGKVLRDGSVKGFVFYYDRGYEPPGENSLRECSTDGLLRWRAEAVGPSR